MKITYYGYNGLSTGYGKAADEMVAALTGAGAQVDIMPIPRLSPDEGLFAGSVDAIIIHALPFHAGAIRRMHHGHPKMPFIAYTTWEGASMARSADIGHALAGFDQVWVPSERNVVDLSSAVNQNRLWIVPHSFEEDSLIHRRSPRVRNKEFTFYTIGHWSGRKNIDGLIVAWARAFTDKDPVQLFIHSFGAPPASAQVALMSTGVDVRDHIAPIVFRTDKATDDDIRRWHRDFDCYVTATRGEAFNLPAFDAVLAGRPVITTGATGAEEYLERARVYPSDLQTHPRPIGWRLQPARDDVRFDAPDQNGMAKVTISGSHGVTCRHDWLEPDLIELADRMRKTFEAHHASNHPGHVPYHLTTLTERFGRRAVGAAALGHIRNSTSKGTP